MNTVTIRFTANGQELKGEGCPIRIASNTVEYVKAVFALGEGWTDFDLGAVRAVWYNDSEQIATVLDEDGVCYAPREVLAYTDTVRVNLVGSDTENNTLVDRLTSYPEKALCVNADARVEGSETVPVTPSQFEQYIAIVSDLVDSVKDITNTVLNDDYTLTIYFSDGTSYTTPSIRGEQGAPGATGATPDFSIGEVETLAPGEDATATVTGTAENPVLNLGIPKGEQGDVSIADLAPFMIEDTASGTIASFPDGQAVFPLKSCVVDIEPVQDLHGYDKPWVGGAGANKWDEEWENGRINIADGTDRASNGLRSKNYIPCLPSTEYYFKKGTYDGGSGFVFFYGSDKSYINYTTANNSTFTTPNDAYFIRFSIFTDSAVTQYNHDTAVNYPSSITTYSPWENICPITGWTGCEVDVCGVNLFDKSVAVNGERYNASGTASVANTRARSALIRVKPSTAYYFTNVIAGGDYSAVWWYDKDGNNVGYNSIAGSAGTSVSGGFTSPATAYYVGVNFLSSAIDSVQLEEGSTATPYTPYNDTTYNITWQTEAGTVYGGTVDLVTGVLFYDEEWKEIDLGDLVWSRSSGASSPSGYVFSTQSLNDIIAKADADGIVGMSDRYGTDISWSYTSQITNGSFMTNNAGTQLYIRDDRYDGMTGAQFQPYVEGVKFYYKLKKSAITPIQLDPVQVACLLGRNNVWADCGAVAVRYIADTKLYLQKITL